MAVERQQLHQLLCLTKIFYAIKVVRAFSYDLSLTKANLRAGWRRCMSDTNLTLTCFLKLKGSMTLTAVLILFLYFKSP